MLFKKTRDEIISFFENLFGRRFSEAEKTMKSVREKDLGNAEFKEGYLNALEGLLVSYRSGDERDFLNKAETDAKSLNGYKKQFKEFVKDGVKSQFDIGFFLAWSDFMQYCVDTKKQK
jgi:hypothetical protein